MENIHSIFYNVSEYVQDLKGLMQQLDQRINTIGKTLSKIDDAELSNYFKHSQTSLPAKNVSEPKGVETKEVEQNIHCLMCFFFNMSEYMRDLKELTQKINQLMNEIEKIMSEITDDGLRAQTVRCQSLNRNGKKKNTVVDIQVEQEDYCMVCMVCSFFKVVEHMDDLKKLVQKIEQQINTMPRVLKPGQ